MGERHDDARRRFTTPRPRGHSRRQDRGHPRRRRTPSRHRHLGRGGEEPGLRALVEPDRGRLVSHLPGHAPRLAPHRRPRDPRARRPHEKRAVEGRGGPGLRGQVQHPGRPQVRPRSEAPQVAERDHRARARCELLGRAPFPAARRTRPFRRHDENLRSLHAARGSCRGRSRPGPADPSRPALRAGPARLDRAVSALPHRLQPLLRRKQGPRELPDHDPGRPHPHQQQPRGGGSPHPEERGDPGIQVQRRQDPADQPRPLRPQRGQRPRQEAHRRHLRGHGCRRVGGRIRGQDRLPVRRQPDVALSRHEGRSGAPRRRRREARRHGARRASHAGAHEGLHDLDDEGDRIGEDPGRGDRRQSQRQSRLQARRQLALIRRSPRTTSARSGS